MNGQAKITDDVLKMTSTTRISDAFVYPLRGNGLYILLGYAIIKLILVILNWLLMSVPMLSASLGWFVAIPRFLFYAYVYTFVFHVLTSSANGEPALPDWPDFSDWREEILQPALLIAVTAMICFGPMIFYNLFGPVAGDSTGFLSRYPTWLWAYFFFALFYFPMGLLAVILHDSLIALNPYLIVKSIIKTFPDYFLTWLAIMTAPAFLILISRIDFSRFVFDLFLEFYFLLVVARSVGLLYHRNQQKLNWFSS